MEPLLMGEYKIETKKEKNLHSRINMIKIT